MQSRIPFPDRLGAFTIRFRVPITILFAALIVLALVYAQRISIVFQATDILNPSNPASQEFVQITETFGSTATIVVAVEGPDPASMEAAADAMVERIRGSERIMRYIRSVDLGAPPEYILQWGMVMLPPDEITELHRWLSQDGLVPFLTEINDSLEDQMFGGDVGAVGTTAELVGLELLGRVEALVTTLTEAVQAPPSGDDELWARRIVESSILGSRFTYSPEQDMLLFYLMPSFAVDNLESMQAITTLLADLSSQIEVEHPGISVGLGGGILQNRAQYDALRVDMVLPSFAALLLIVLLFLVSFERVRNILLAVVSLVVGIILTVGVIGLTVGQISIVTSVFAVVLVGLGIDFGIHLVTNFDDFRTRGESAPEAVRSTMRSSGGPIMLGGLTTAAVFFAVMSSGSPAIREFGFIGGIGILLTLGSMVLLLPALLISFGTGPRTAPSRLHIVRYNFLRYIGRGVARARVPIMIGTGVVTVFLGALIPANRVSYDIFAMGPTTGPIIETQRRIIDRMGVSPFVAFAMTGSVDAARSLSTTMRSDELVANVTSVADLLVPDDQVPERLAAIRGTGAANTNRAPDRPTGFTAPQVQALADEIQRLEWNVIEAADLSVAALGPGNRIVRRRDAIIREIRGAEVGAPGREVFQRLIAVLEDDPDAAARRLDSIDAGFADALAAQLQRMSVDRAPTMDDIPPALLARFVDPARTRYLVQIIPTAAVQDDDETALAFDRRTRGLHPGITGSLSIYISLVAEIFGDGWVAALYGAATVLVLMLLIFRSIRRVALAFGVVVVAMVWMFGLLPLVRVPLVMTGALALPLILGIGMAYTLHILHRYEHERGSIENTLRYSGKAVFLSSATTGIGFGSLGLMGTIGLASGLGYLLLVGIACCLVGSMIALPAFLATVGPVRTKEGEISSREEVS